MVEFALPLELAIRAWFSSMSVPLSFLRALRVLRASLPKLQAELFDSSITPHAPTPTRPYAPPTPLLPRRQPQEFVRSDFHQDNP